MMVYIIYGMCGGGCGEEGVGGKFWKFPNIWKYSSPISIYLASSLWVFESKGWYTMVDEDSW